MKCHHQPLTVGLQSPWFTASASRLVNGLDNKDVLGAALQAVHRVVVLLDVGNNHPALQGVAETWEGGGGGEGETNGETRRREGLKIKKMISSGCVQENNTYKGEKQSFPFKPG